MEFGFVGTCLLGFVVMLFLIFVSIGGGAVPFIGNDAVVLGILIVILVLIFVIFSSANFKFKKFYIFVFVLLFCYFILGLFGMVGFISGDHL